MSAGSAPPANEPPSIAPQPAGIAHRVTQGRRLGGVEEGGGGPGVKLSQSTFIFKDCPSWLMMIPISVLLVRSFFCCSLLLQAGVSDGGAQAKAPTEGT